MQDIFTSVNVLAPTFDSSTLIFLKNACKWLVSVQTPTSTCCRLCLPFRGTAETEKKEDLSDLLSELKKKVWKERGSEQGLKEEEEYAEEGERKDEQFRGKQLNAGSLRG